VNITGENVAGVNSAVVLQGTTTFNSIGFYGYSPYLRADHADLTINSSLTWTASSGIFSSFDSTVKTKIYIPNQ
jgi:hypothetical protein